jgi:dynein assembly factor 1
MMTNRFFWELFKKEWKKYYRTPSLNEKLYLHFKGFSYIRNMEQFTGLKCLYFEGNGCKSMKGLEHCTEMRSLFMQENMIKVMEGIEHMKELRQLNLSENMIEVVQGLKECVHLDTIHLKRNRIGRHADGSIEALKGLLERPTLCCVDVQDNYIEEPEILDEIFAKLPNLKVLYLLNNPCIKKINGYRKTVISKIPTLTYLDDRPVFEDDRRRAEAWTRGGIEEERLEIKKIKKEKDDKHWANHEAFRCMVNKAREEKKSKEEEDKEAKAYKKKSMKDMMAAAKIAKEQGRGAETG